MTTLEAKEKISKEFISRYREWLKDIAEMPEYEYGRKYGWKKPKEQIKDNLTTIVKFQKYIFQGRWLPAWEKAGYDRNIIFELNRNGFLSYQWYSNWNARATGKTDFYYISQATAKEIYKAYK